MELWLWYTFWHSKHTNSPIGEKLKNCVCYLISLQGESCTHPSWPITIKTWISLYRNKSETICRSLHSNRQYLMPGDLLELSLNSENSKNLLYDDWRYNTFLMAEWRYTCKTQLECTGWFTIQLLECSQELAMRIYMRAHYHAVVTHAHLQLNLFYHPFYPDVNHVRKDTRPSPAFPYCKRWKAGRGLGIRLTEKVR